MKTAKQILTVLWRRSIFDGAECKTVEEYAERVAARLLLAYGRAPRDESLEALVELMRELEIIH